MVGAKLLDSRLVVGVIGPTKIEELSQLTGKPLEVFARGAQVVGQAIAEAGCALMINSDGGMLLQVALAYLAFGGEELVMIYPENPKDWPNSHAYKFLFLSTVALPVRDWRDANLHVVREADLVIGVGPSLGTFGEISYVKWDTKFNMGRLRVLLLLQELWSDPYIQLAKTAGRKVKVLADMEHLPRHLNQFVRKHLKAQHGKRAIATKNSQTLPV